MPNASTFGAHSTETTTADEFGLNDNLGIIAIPDSFWSISVDLGSNPGSVPLLQAEPESLPPALPHVFGPPSATAQSGSPGGAAGVPSNTSDNGDSQPALFDKQAEPAVGWGDTLPAVQSPARSVADPAPIGPSTTTQVFGASPELSPALTAAAASTGFHINLIWDANALAAPQSFRDGIQAAANILQATITNNITVNITIGYGEIKGDPEPPLGASAGPATETTATYSDLRTSLLNHATTAADMIGINALPDTTSLDGQVNFSFGDSEAKALGLVSSAGSEIDGNAGFGVQIPDGALVGVALHELTHAMGRVPNNSILSLYRYTSSGVHDYQGNVTPSDPSYFSIDGGATKLAYFGINSDPSDFLGPPGSTLTPNDPFNEFYDPSTPTTTLQVLTSVDLAMLDVLGFTVVPEDFVISAGQVYSGATIIYSSNTETVQSGGTLVNALVLSGGLETVNAGGKDQSATISSGGVQHVFGSATNTVVNGGQQFVESGGLASRTLVSNGGAVIIAASGATGDTTVGNGATEEVLSGGVAITPTVSGGGFESVLSGGTASYPTLDGPLAKLSLQAGAVVSGRITFAAEGGELQIFGSAMPTNRITSFLYGDTIDLASVPFDAGDTISMVNSGTAHNELQITEGGQTYNLEFNASENFIGQYFHLNDDGHGGTLITDTFTPGNGPAVAFTDAIGPVNDQDNDTWNHVITNQPSGTIAFTNWTGNVVPTSSYDVLIDGLTATIRDPDFYGNIDNVDSLTLTSTGRLDIRDRGLQLGNGATNNGFALVNNGLVTIQNISLQISGGNITGAGRIEITQPNASLYILGTVTVGGNQTIVLTNDVTTGGLAQISNNDSNVLSTLVNQGLIEGGGTIGQTNYGLPIDIVNDGTIAATNDTNALVIEGNFDPHSHMTNDGTLEARSAAGLHIDSFTIVNVGPNGPGTLLGHGTGSSFGDTPLLLQQVTLEGGLITTSGTAGSGIVEFLNGPSTLDGQTVGAVTVTSNSNLVIGNGTDVIAFGSLINQGTISLLANNHNPALEIGVGDLVLNGGGKLILGPTPLGYQYASGITGADANTETTLENVDNTISGLGTFGGSGILSDLPAGNLHLQNDAAGKVIADDAAIPLTFNPRTTNSGLIEATGAAGLVIAGQTTVTIDQSGGGTLSALGTDGVGGVSTADGIKAHIDLNTVDLIGGTLTTNALGVINVLGGQENIFDGTAAVVHNKADLVVQTAILTLKGTIDNTATVDAIYGGVVHADNTTLQGGGSVILDSNAAEITGADVASATTLHNVDNTITGNGWIGTGSTQDFTQYQLFLDNQAGGTIDSTATDTSAPMTLAKLSASNAGLIEDTGAGGLLLQQATVTQTGGGTIAANGNGSHVDLIGSTIVGGTLSTSGGGVIEATNGVFNTLDGSAGAVVNAGSLTDQDTATLTLKGTLDNTGVFTLEQGLVDIAAGDVFLTGGGTVAMKFTTGRDSNINTFFSDAGSPTVLHNVDNTIDGAGWFGTAPFGGTPQMSLDNEAGGTIAADNPDATLNFDTGATVTNAGLIRADNGGTLVVHDALSNSGSVVADGGTLDLLGVYSGNAITLEGGGTVNVEKNGSVNIAFAGAGTLVLPDAATPDGFFGTVTGFGDGDALDLSGLGFNASYQVIATNSGPGLVTLQIAPNGDITQTVAIAGHLSGNYADSDFALSQDATGGTLVSFVSAPPPPPPVLRDFDADNSDFDGSGKDDILLRTSNGGFADFTMNGAAIAGADALSFGGTPITLDASWAVTGTADFNGDGKTDILLRNPDTSGFVDFTMSGSAITGADNITFNGTTVGLDPSWSVAGAADFNGDGKADILLRNPDTSGFVDFTMSGSAITGADNITFNGTTVGLDPSWAVVGTGDFNGDGKADILLRNPDTSGFVDFTMNGSAITGADNVSFGGVPVGLDSSWSVLATGDFNGDGKSDILLHNTDGSLTDFTMNGAAIAGADHLTFGGNVVKLDSAWTFADLGDFNGDGKSDILLRNTNGAFADFTMNGAAITAADALTFNGNPVILDNSWHT